jgi:hypothetical protein
MPPQSGLQKPGSGSTHLIITDRASIRGLNGIPGFFAFFALKRGLKAEMNRKLYLISRKYVIVNLNRILFLSKRITLWP